MAGSFFFRFKLYQQIIFLYLNQNGYKQHVVIVIFIAWTRSGNFGIFAHFFTRLLCPEFGHFFRPIVWNCVVRIWQCVWCYKEGSDIGSHGFLHKFTHFRSVRHSVDNICKSVTWVVWLPRVRSITKIQIHFIICNCYSGINLPTYNFTHILINLSISQDKGFGSNIDL